MTRRKGPNNGRCVIWALSELFLFLLLFFLILINILLFIQLVNYEIHVMERDGRLGESFYFPLCYLDTNLCFITYIGLKSMKYMTGRGMEGNDDKKGPK